MARERIFAGVLAGLLATLLLAPQGVLAGTPPPEESSSTPNHTPTLSRARQLLRAGRTAEAARIIDAALAAARDDATLCLFGEIQFRRARFTEAAAAFAGALELNPENPRAHWG